MIIFFKDLFNKLKITSVSKKILFSIYLMLYLVIIAFSLIKVNYSVLLVELIQ